MAGLTHGADDDTVVLVLRQFVGDIGHHGVVDGHARQHAVRAVDVDVQHVVGDDHTVAAPLAAQDAVDQARVAAGPDRAPASVSDHNAVAVAHLNGSLEGFQVDLSGGLLVDPDAQADAILLAVVQRKVLHDDVNTLFLDGGNLVGAHHTGEEAVLGVILKVAAAVRGAVDVVARAVQAGNVGAQAVVADDRADRSHQVGVEGRSHDVLRRKGRGSQLGSAAAQQAGGQALGAVLIAGAGGLDALDRHRPVERIANEGVHLVEGQVVQQVIPLRVVVVEADHVIQGDAIVLAHGRQVHGLVVGGVVADILQVFLQLLGQGQLDGLGGQGTVPVAAAQPGHGVVLAVVQIRVGAGQLVGDGGAVLTDRVGRGVELILSPRIGQVGVAVGGHLAVGGSHRIALGSQDVVHGLVGVVGGGEIVVAGIQNVGARAVGVIAGDIALVDVHGNDLGGTGGQFARLAEADQGDGGLLDAVLLVVVGVGALHVELHGALARDCAGVRDLDSDGINVQRVVVVDGHIAELEIGVAQTIAEGVRHNVAVGVVARVARAHDVILIARLVVLVAYIDALLVDHVGAALGRHIAALDIAVVDAGGEIPHGGGAVIVIAVGIDQTAGGVDVADQNLGNGVDAGDAHVADPECGIHVVVVVLQEVDLQGVSGVDEDDDALDLAAFLHGGEVFQHRFLVVVQCQVVDLAVAQVRTLAADARESDDGCVAVLSDAGLYIIGVDVPGHFRRGGAGGGYRAAIGAGVILACAGGVEIPQRRVDGDTDLFEGGAQGVGGRGIDIAGAGAAVDEVDAGGGEGADLRVLGQGQRAVVHQQGRALSLDLLGDGQTVVDHLFRRGKVGGKVLCVGILVFQFPERAADKRRNCVVEGIQDGTQGDENDHEDGAEDRQDLPPQDGLTLGLFVCLFQRFLLGFDFVHDSLLVLIFNGTTPLYTM